MSFIDIKSYGAIKQGGKSHYELKQVDMPILSNEKCLTKFTRYNSTLQLCAGETGGNKDTCQGDSGGPLNMRSKSGRWHLIGLTSYGFTCGDGGVFTRLSAHNDWIKKVVQTQ